MDSLFLKDERLEVSPAFVGYYIMKSVLGGRESKKSLLDIANDLARQPWYSPKHMHLGLLFLFAIGAVDFESPYVRSNV